MRKLKIGILVESFPRISEAWLVNQIIDLMERGNEVLIYSVYQSRDSIIHQQVKNYHLLDSTQYFFYPKGNKAKQIWLGLVFMTSNLGNASFSKALIGIKAFILKKLEPLFIFNYIFLKGMEDLDILHAHFGGMGVVASNMKKVRFLRKTKIVVSFHGEDIFPFKREIYKKQYLIFNDFANMLLVNSEYSKTLLNDIINFHNLKIIPVGLDCQYFQSNAKINDTSIKILFVGRLVHWKGPDFAIDIFKKLLKTNKKIELSIIGEGNLTEFIKNKIEKLNIGAKVNILGALSQEDIIIHFKASDIFLYPATYEKSTGAADTQGLVIQEAQAMALPVVCADVGGIKYGMVDEETGFLVDEGDLEGFAEKIQVLIDQPELRQKMGKAGREFVKKNFDSKVIGDQLMSVYKEILSKN